MKTFYEFKGYQVSDLKARSWNAAVRMAEKHGADQISTKPYLYRPPASGAFAVPLVKYFTGDVR